MTRTGATLAVHALEQLGIEHTFGIPGVHNTELYDALGASDGQPAIVDVNIDYRRRTQMTTSVVKTNLSRFSTSEKIRFVARAAKRHLFG